MIDRFIRLGVFTWGTAVTAVIAVAAITMVAPPPAQAQLNVDITRGQVEPLPVAIPSLFGNTTAEKQRGSQIAEVIASDLNRSGLFRTIDRRAFIQSRESLRAQPRFSDWRKINAQGLMVGKVALQPDGRLKVEFRLWDVFAGRQMDGRSYSTAPANWRRIAHLIADVIYKRITGEDGYFDTRVVYVAESGTPANRIKRLAIMDQDGQNHRFLTNGSSLVLTPRFSPTAQEITYLSYVNGRPRVYLYNIDAGRSEVLGEFPGMTFAPRFSPDGNQVIMSIATRGNSDVQVMDLRTRRLTRLTKHPAIDTSPSFAPNGQRIVFNSDRSGSQQIYVMDSNGRNVKRISYGTGRYATPVWSPRGDLIAFTKMSGGRFAIGVMRVDGTGERLLTDGYLVEGPTWAPNGRVLIFFRETPGDASGRGRTTKLYSIDLTGYNEYAVSIPAGGSDPAWSPPM